MHHKSCGRKSNLLGLILIWLLFGPLVFLYKMARAVVVAEYRAFRNSRKGR